MNNTLVAIDWSRMAEPQADQYDAQVVRALLAAGSRQQKGRPAAGEPTICEGQIALRYRDIPAMSPPHFSWAPLDHPNLTAATDYLRRWSAGYAQFVALIDTVHPCLDPKIRPEYQEISTGSSSYSSETWFGTVCVTVDHPIGCAQGLVRELAHQKLHALGISPTRAERLIANNPEVHYPNPIHPGLSQPLPALLHTIYPLLYVTELDVQMLLRESDKRRRDQILQLLLRNLVRLEASHAALIAQVVPDWAGTLFIDALNAWARRVVAQGSGLLDGNGYETHVV